MWDDIVKCHGRWYSAQPIRVMWDAQKLTPAGITWTEQQLLLTVSILPEKWSRDATVIIEGLSKKPNTWSIM